MNIEENTLHNKKTIETMEIVIKEEKFNVTKEISKDKEHCGLYCQFKYKTFNGTTESLSNFKCLAYNKELKVDNKFKFLEVTFTCEDCKKNLPVELRRIRNEFKINKKITNEEQEEIILGSSITERKEILFNYTNI